MSLTSHFINKVFGKSNIAGLENLAYSIEERFKIVVFSPAENAEKIILAMASAGAGQIGNYAVIVPDDMKVYYAIQWAYPEEKLGLIKNGIYF